MSLKKICFVLLLALSFSACDKKTSDTKSEETKNAAKDNAEKKQEDKKDADSAKTEASEPFVVSGPVAEVNGKPIPGEKFKAQIAPLSQMIAQIPPENLNRIKDDIINRLIDETLLRQRIGDGIDKVTPEELKEEKDKFIAQFPSEEVFKQQLDAMKMSESQLENDMKLSIALRKLLASEYGVKVSDEEVKKFYDENKDTQFSKKRQVHARHILLKLDKGASDADVKKVTAQINKIEKEARKKDADFAKLAEKYSEGPTKSRGGDLGFTEEGSLVPQFEKVAFALKPGQISKPVRTEFGFHIIKVEELKPASTQSFDEVKKDIQDHLLVQKLGEQVQKLLKELHDKATIKRLDGDNIKLNPEFKKAADAKKENAPALPAALPPGAVNTEDMKLKLDTK